MPAGWLVIKGLATWAPYRWGAWAGFLVLMQLIASLGMLRLLRSMFGDTRVVLVLLAGYCFLIFTVPAGVWFAAGINQLPFQVALVFGLHAHLAYLRTHRWQSLVATLAWTVFGLAFYEKAVLLFGFYALFALCWFARGTADGAVRRTVARLPHGDHRARRHRHSLRRDLPEVRSPRHPARRHPDRLRGLPPRRPSRSAPASSAGRSSGARCPPTPSPTPAT